MLDHEVQQGECITSIAFQYGFHWETIWNHPQNSELKRKRKNPDALFPDDVVHIPEKEIKEVSGATERRHRFKLRGVPAMLKLRLLHNEEPRSNEKYVLDIDGIMFSGQTNADGWIEQKISPSSKQGRLILQDGLEEYPLALGQIDPLDEISGLQGRLKNLGFYQGEIDGELNDETEEAIESFQQKHGLEVTGQADQSTKDMLSQDYGH